MIVLKNTCVNLVLSIFNLPLSYYRSNVKERMKTMCKPDYVKRMSRCRLEIFKKALLEIIKAQKSGK